jgi:hypothetical protein
MRMPGARRILTFLAIAVPSLAALRAVSSAPLRLPLEVEKLTAPEGTALPSYDTIELALVGGSRYDVKLSPGDGAPRLSGVDLGLLMPRVPRLAQGNEALTRLALIQREFNRNEIHNPLPDGTDLSIANNCLERGLWEVKLAKPDAGKTVTLFHAWFTFPREEYAVLFQKVNGGLDEQGFDGLFAKYPGVGGFSLPLGIGTPIIHAKAEERAAEVAEDRPRYLMILDAKGYHVDTHLTGVDGLYAWREAGSPGKLHVWLVSYERIALIAHFSALWPAAS